MSLSNVTPLDLSAYREPFFGRPGTDRTAAALAAAVRHHLGGMDMDDFGALDLEQLTELVREIKDHMAASKAAEEAQHAATLAGFERSNEQIAKVVSEVREKVRLWPCLAPVKAALDKA